MSGTALPLVSVIIPAYNAEKHILQCVQSVLAQTYPNIEVIIVDDGSHDKTVVLVRELESQRIHIFEQNNLGGCAARNRGFHHARGKYIQFLDADDLLSPDKIEKQVIRLEEHPGRVAVCTTVHFRDGEDHSRLSRPDESHYLYDTQDIAEFLCRLWGADGTMWMVQTSAWLTPRSLISKAGPWDETVILDQDGEFFSRVLMQSQGILMCGGVNYYRKYVYGANIAGRYRRKEPLASAIRVAGLKSGRLLAMKDNARSRKAAANLFMQLAIDAYPVFPDLYRHALDKVKEMGEKPVIPVLGGRTIEMIKKWFGWRMAKKISHYVHYKQMI